MVFIRMRQKVANHRPYTIIKNIDTNDQPYIRFTSDIATFFQISELFDRICMLIINHFCVSNPKYVYHEEDSKKRGKNFTNGHKESGF